MANSQDYPDMPERMQQLWQWVIALDAWDWGNPLPLSDAIKREPIPPEFVEPIAELILGKRKPKPKKATAKAKLPADERLKIAASVSTIIWLTNRLRSISAEIGERLKPGKEPIEIIRALEDEKRDAIHQAALDLGVSTETIENLLRDLRGKIAKWPTV